MRKKAIISTVAFAVVASVGFATPASADEGQHLGQLGQPCTSGY